MNNTVPAPPDFYSIRHLMALLDVKSRTTIYDMVRRGDFEMVNFRGNSRITRESYEAWKARLVGDRAARQLSTNRMTG
jgi:hypothetical protein